MLTTTAAHTKVNLQQQLKVNLTAEVTSSISGLRQQLFEELAAAREQQFKEVQEQVKTAVSKQAALAKSAPDSASNNSSLLEQWPATTAASGRAGFIDLRWDLQPQNSDS